MLDEINIHRFRYTKLIFTEGHPDVVVFGVEDGLEGAELMEVVKEGPEQAGDHGLERRGRRRRAVH